MREERKKRKKRRVIKKKVLKLFLIILVLGLIVFYIFNLKITQIEIIGTNLITDNEIIEAAEIKDYPPIFSPKLFNIKNKIKTVDLVDDVSISKNLYGKLTINIKEAKILFYNKTKDKLVLSNKKEIPYVEKFLGVPTLLNYVPDSIYNDLIEGMIKVDQDILQMISEMEYSPSKTANGEDIDNTRFLLRMNDSNTVYMNTINITKLNKYIEITSANANSRGILYLDSSLEDSAYYETYDSKKKAEEEKAKKEEENNGETGEQRREEELSTEDGGDNQ